jgi:hypothetical protein
MANLPLDANVQFMTVMAPKMPFIGRGSSAVGFFSIQGAPHGAQALPNSVGAARLDNTGLVR